MTEHILYREDKLSIGITVILGIIAVLMTIYLVAQMLYGPIGSKPAPTWSLGLLAGFFILCTINFFKIRITLTDDRVKVYYGVFGSSRKWTELRGCELDTKNGFYGYGIRFGKYKAEWSWIYNVIGGARVVFLAKPDKPGTLIVSTRNPDEILRIAKEMIPEPAPAGQRQ